MVVSHAQQIKAQWILPVAIIPWKIKYKNSWHVLFFITSAVFSVCMCFWHNIILICSVWMELHKNVTVRGIFSTISYYEQTYVHLQSCLIRKKLKFVCWIFEATGPTKCRVSLLFPRILLPFRFCACSEALKTWKSLKLSNGALIV